MFFANTDLSVRAGLKGGYFSSELEKSIKTFDSPIKINSQRNTYKYGFIGCSSEQSKENGQRDR